MSDDEIFVLLVSGIVSLLYWGKWYLELIQSTSLGTTHAQRMPLYVLPIACLMLLLIVLRSVSSEDVRSSTVYTIMYTVFGLGWIGAFGTITPRLGLNYRLDALERRNPATQLALCGAFTGAILAFAGANIGNGPGWWVVFFCAMLSTVTLLMGWWVAQCATHIADSIAIDQDCAAGIRLGAYLTCGGVVLGRSVAGDWVSVEATLADFADISWPFWLLTVLFVAIHFPLRASARYPVPGVISAGWIPAVAMGLLTALYVKVVGWW